MSVTEQELTDYFQHKFTNLNKESKGNLIPEIEELREEAIEKFSQLGFPLKKTEEYKYTPITRSILKSLRLDSEQPTEATMLPPFGEHLMPELDGLLLVYWNGKLVFKSEDIPDELLIEQFNELTPDHQNEILGYLSSLSNLNADVFASLNTAFINQGSLIKIADGAIIEQPIAIYHFFDGRDQYLFSNQTSNSFRKEFSS